MNNWFKRTRISKTAFTYWHNSFFEPDWTWNGKIFYSEDMSFNVLNCEVFKVMSSGGSHSTIVKDQKALNIKINGKPSIIITAANATLLDELIRRFAVIQLDESKEQDDLILEHQSQQAQTGKKPEYDELIKNSISYLKPAKIIIPFADLITPEFKKLKANVIIRTNYNRFIDLIKYSAIIHQYQRERTNDDTIYAQPEDYDKAVDWFDYMFKNQHLLPITHDQERLIEVVKNLGPQATVKDIISEATFAGRSWTYTNLNILTEKGFLTKERIHDETGISTKKLDVYTVKEKEGLKLPYYWDLT